jgi:RND superfamily putative drug exporter
MLSATSLVRRAAGASARRPRRTIALWLVLVAALSLAGGAAGTRELSDREGEVGEAARAEARIAAAGLGSPATERIVLLGPGARAAAAGLRRRLAGERDVAAVADPVASPRGLLVEATLRGDPADASDHVAGVERAVAATRRAHPATTLHQSGDASIEKALDTMIEADMSRTGTLSIPLTLIVLVLAFGAVVAAAVPLLLGVTAVVAGMGAFALISHVAPDGGAGGSLVAMFGLAVAVDYSLFYVRREREERRAGKGPQAALDAAAATVGRAIVLSGVTVIIAVAGLLFSGLAVFTSMALGTIVVVAISIAGSLTVLPAVLALLGDRIDAGRLPLLGRRREGTGAWGKLARRAAMRPLPALGAAVCVLGGLAVPAIALKTGESGAAAFPPGHPAVAAAEAVERAFPGAPDSARLVVRGDVDDASLQRLGERALAITGGAGAPQVERAGDTAVVSVAFPDLTTGAAERTVQRLRGLDVEGGELLVTGSAAQDFDFSARLRTATPIVIGLVLGLAFLLLTLTMRAPKLALGVVLLNLLSVAAAYGVLAAVFQNSWAEGLLGFESSGTIADWLPLFAFVILFGLSMDYTIVVLERIREGAARGLDPREAAAEGVAATAGMVTSAALVMVVVFSAFATSDFLDMKQLGVGLAVAILLDATIVRGVALPAVAALAGRRGAGMMSPAMTPASDAR